MRRKRSRVNVEPGRSITAPHESSSSDTDIDTQILQPVLRMIQLEGKVHQKENMEH